MANKKPLDGIKVLDFGWVGVGPMTAMRLGWFGATVIRIDCASKPDVLRVATPFKDAKPGINRSQFWASFNSSKLVLGLNMAHPDAIAIARRLAVEWADVVIVGMTPKAMKNWGLEYEELAKERPDLIYLSTCQMGNTGPYAMYAGYGGQGAAMGGCYAVTGWPDRDPAVCYGAHTDFITPHFVPGAVVAALLHRRKTGQGQYIDSSQTEAGVHFQAPLVMDYVINGRVFNRRGNHDDRGAPHGAYRCLGDDRWANICVFSDEEWQAFGKVIGNPEWTKDPKFATFLARKQNEDELDRLVSEWTRDYTPEEVMVMMQAAGVPAGVVSNQADLHDDPQIKHRGFFVWANHTACGPMPYDGLMYSMSKTPGEVRAAGCIGEHNEQVLKGMLGLGDDAIGDLYAKGALEIDLSA